MRSKRKGRIPEWPNGADCKSAGLCLRWFESIFAHHFLLKLRGSSSVDRASAFQAEGRGFEPRLPLKNSVDRFLSALFLFLGVMASEAWEIDLGCVLQSLRLSTDNEQNLYNLAHCSLGGCISSPPSRKRQGGVKRVPQALQACILAIRWDEVRGKSGRGPVAPRRDPTSAPYYVDNQQPALHPHAYPVAPRRDPTTEWHLLRPTMLNISRVGSRLAATYQAIVSSPRHPGRTKARPYDCSVLCR